MKSGATQISLEPLRTHLHRTDDPIVAEFREKLKTAEDLISKLAYGLREIQFGQPSGADSIIDLPTDVSEEQNADIASAHSPLQVNLGFKFNIDVEMGKENQKARIIQWQIKPSKI